jgi:hypothetical protein
LPEFQKDPSEVLELLELLKDDDELYVRRSVANNLNDIAKDHPDIVIETLKKWNYSASDGTKWIIKHASRSLIKDGHPEALELLGFKYGVNINITDFQASETVKFGEALLFSFELSSLEKDSVNLMVDYVIHHVKANGKTSPKVFKLAKKTLAPSEKSTVQRKHAMRPISTRKYYPGTHSLEIQVNGKILARKDFELIMP